MPIEVTMPKLSPTMETGVIAQWLVKVGDQIKEGDVLADIETDKATMQMKSYDDGTIVHIDHGAGDEVALGQRVMVLAKKNEDPKKVAAELGLGDQAKAGSAAKGAAPATAQRAEAAAPVAAGVATTGARPRVRAATATVSRRATTATGWPPSPRTTAAGSRPARWPGRSRPMPNSTWRGIRGSGPNGRIVRRDVEARLQGGPAAATQQPARTTPAPAAAPAPLASQRIPHSRMRKTIAQRMAQAKQAAPEIHLTVDIRVDRLVAAREDLNKRLSPAKVSSCRSATSSPRPSPWPCGPTRA